MAPRLRHVGLRRLVRRRDDDAVGRAGVTDPADLTPAQMSTIRAGWAVIWPLYALALLVGLAGSAVLNNTLRAARRAG